MALERGAKLGPYEVLAPLGAGGMGEVYREKDSRQSREVAVKVLPEATTNDPEALARFGREAKTVRRCRIRIWSRCTTSGGRTGSPTRSWSSWTAKPCAPR